MEREGELDPLSGQRAAFPLDTQEGGPAAQYLRAVRDEAHQLALSALSRKRRAATESPAAGQRPRADSQQLNYDGVGLSITEVQKVTAGLFGAQFAAAPAPAATQRADQLAALYYSAYTTFRNLPPEHPEECTSLATWRAYTAQHEPVPLDHTDSFRVFRYLAKWCAGQPPHLHFVWAWSLLLRTPDVLDSDEIAALRELCRSMGKHGQEPLAAAFVRVVGTVFGQTDLLQ